jgi:deoxyribodipyrimidine photo-lyase
LRERGVGLLVRQGAITEVFADIHAQYGIDALHAHEETGDDWSYRRDCHVRAWCRERAIALHEHPNLGVIRGLNDRNAWHPRWQARMREPVIDPPQRPCQAAADPFTHTTAGVSGT